MWPDLPVIRMRKLFLLAAAVLAGLGSALADRTQECAQIGDPDLTIRACSEVIGQGGNVAWAHNNRGLALTTVAKYDLAVADYNKAIELSPGGAKYYNGRAWALFKAGKAQDALRDGEKALSLNPDDPDALDTRGHILEALGRREEAVGDFKRALSKNRNMVESQMALQRLGATSAGTIISDKVAVDQLAEIRARCLNQGKRFAYNVAIAGCTALIDSGAETRANLAVLYSNRGDAYFQKKQFDKALSDHSKAIEINDKEALAYYRRGAVYVQMKDLDRAIADYSASIAINPQDASSYYNRAVAFASKGEKSRAIADLRKVLALDPMAPDAKSALKDFGAAPRALD